MRIGDARVSTTEQNLGLWHDDLKPATDASVDVTAARNPSGCWTPITCGGPDLRDCLCSQACAARTQLDGTGQLRAERSAGEPTGHARLHAAVTTAFCDELFTIAP